MTTAPPEQGLIERLRDAKWPEGHHLAVEAADALAAQSTEVERLRAERDALSAALNVWQRCYDTNEGMPDDLESAYLGGCKALGVNPKEDV